MSDDRLAFKACEGRRLWRDLSASIRRVTASGILPPLPYNRMGLTNPPDTEWGITVDGPFPDS